jgi:NAD-dependent DNA ligase
MKWSDYVNLVDLAKRYSYEYYVLSKPSVIDADFDSLVDSIEEVERQHPDWTLPDSPTQCVGSDLSDNGRRLVHHRTRMLSCQKAQTKDAVEKWIATAEKYGVCAYVMEWKLDGISCSLVYQDGQLVSAATRGNKDVGQDLLRHVGCMPSVPKRINRLGRVEVRGEIVCPKNELNRLSQSYKDCRSAASSLCNQVCPSSDCSRLVFCAWQMDADGIIAETESMSQAKTMGFIAFSQRVKATGVCRTLDDFSAHRSAFAYPTDGVVIKVDDKAVAESMGCTEHHPKSSIAYKFAASKVQTRCVRIEVSVGATGRRTPVAYLEPVMILGREVRKVSLGSERRQLELGVIPGCMVEVGLSNDVTPKIYGVVAGAEELDAQAELETVATAETPVKIERQPSEADVICLTGTIPGIARQDVCGYIRGKGLWYSDRMTKDVTILVVGERGEGTTKYQKAVKYGTELMPYNEFMAWLFRTPILDKDAHLRPLDKPKRIGGAHVVSPTTGKKNSLPLTATVCEMPQPETEPAWVVTAVYEPEPMDSEEDSLGVVEEDSADDDAVPPEPRALIFRIPWRKIGKGLAMAVLIAGKVLWAVCVVCMCVVLWLCGIPAKP